MFSKIKYFLDDWKSEADSTLKFLSSLNDEALEQKVAE